MINSKKKSILWISFYLDNPSLLNILNQLADMGHEMTLVTVQTNRTRSVSRIVKNARVHIFSFPLRQTPLILPPMFAFLLFFYLPILVATKKIDFIIMEPHVHVLGVFSQLIVSKFKKVKFVLDIRSTPVETSGFRGFLMRFWFSVSVLIAMKLFDGITILTSQMKKQVCEDYGLNPERVGVWTSGVSEHLFNPELFVSGGVELKKKLGLSGKFVVFYHGVFTPTRGLAETVGALKILLPKYPNLIFFLLGTGPFSSDLKTLIERENLEANVVIVDQVDQVEVPKFISMCDVGIVPLPNHPYWNFQSPLKLLEYLAMEKVVILTDIPAHRAVVRDAKCGIYISSIEVMEIARAIEWTYLHKENLGEWGKIGRDIVKKEFTWEKVAGDLENYLLSLDKLKIL